MVGSAGLELEAFTRRAEIPSEVEGPQNIVGSAGLSRTFIANDLRM